MHLGKTKAEPQHWGHPCPPLMYHWVHFQIVPWRTSHQQLLVVSPNAWVLAWNSGSTEVNRNFCCWIYWNWICPIRGWISQTKQVPLCTKFSIEKSVYIQCFLCWRRCIHTDLITGLGQSFWQNKLTYDITAVCPFMYKYLTTNCSYYPKFSAHWKLVSS